MHKTLAALALGILVLADGAATIAAPKATPAALPQISGAGPAEARLLRDVLRTVRPSHVASVAFLKGPARVTGYTLPRGVLSLQIRNDPGPRGEWEARMVADLYVIAAARQHLRHVDLAVSAAGRLTINDIGTHGQAAKSLSSVRDLLGPTGVRVLELRHVAGDLALTVQADDPLAFVTHDLGAIFSAAEKVSPDELFVGVEDHDGTMVYAVAHSSNWGGISAASDDYYACGPVVVLPPAPLPACHG